MKISISIKNFRCGILFAVTLAALLHAGEKCVLKFSSCPQSFDKDTIVVPTNVVAISPMVLACQDTAYVESTATSSFFFIIDNSRSMQGNNGSDPTGARFTATKALLDSIYKRQPNAQVGVAVFQALLFFDTSTTSLYWYSKYFQAMQTVYDNQPNQAFMPLLTLNQNYDGHLGIDILDSLLLTTGTGANISLRYSPSFAMPVNDSTTNINIGFLAARQAFANSAAPKTNQYIVFLSDGEATMGANDPGPDGKYYFRDSTRNVPTTFTVFFNSNGSTTVPGSIDTMTRNIRNNGYSSSNPNSADYAINTNFTNLMNVLLNNVISRINVLAVPVQMTINNIVSNSYTNGTFYFPDSFMLGNTVNHYSMVIKYQFTNPGTGQVRDTADTVVFYVKQSANATVPAGFELSCTTIDTMPDSANFTIITPPDSIIAGRPIRAVVRIYNKDGPMPGQYCYPANSGSGAIYQDSIGKGSTPDPTVTTNQGTAVINQAPSATSQVGECFTSGVDTISLTLYRAPYHAITDTKDTMHQLVVLLGNLSATTGPFKVLPGPLYKMQIEDVNGRHMTGIDTLAYPSGAITVYSVGYDLYGNTIGRVQSNWSVDGTLHQPGQTKNTSQLYYDASQVTADESGTLFARALRNAAINDSTGDSLGFFIKGPPSALDSAVTRDMSGNGYLDEIDLYFSKPVSFPPGFSFANITIVDTFAVNGHTVAVPFLVDSMKSVDAGGTKYILYLAENATSLPGVPQTAWRPSVSIAGLENPSSIPPTQCRDGAGPVIWSVVKTIVNVSDRKQDVVQVTFSEPIQGPNGSRFIPASVSPDLVFFDYRKNENGGWDTLKMLESINSFTRMVNDSTLEFVMSNGKDLTTVDYLNIDSAGNQIYDSRARTTGGAGVPPMEDNRKVQVRVNNAPPNRVIAVPNPSGPIFTRPGQQPGKFSFVNNTQARDWVRQDNAGTVITFDLSPPKGPGDSIVAQCKIFDVIGNVVTEADTVIRYTASQDTSTAIQYNAYWNGSNSRGTRVAPGLYSSQVILMYYSSTRPKQVVKMRGVIGIAF